MAGPYQPESPTTYPVGVYQLQTTDPVQGGLGGVANQPLLDLANRTAWLYQQLNSVLNGTVIPPTVAPLNSPTFTGSPKAPTAPLGDNSTLISTTAFVQNSVYGILSKSVAGGANVPLTTVEAGNGVLILSGALTANIAVIVPNAAKHWIISNQTTGPYQLSVKTAAGSGIGVTQGLFSFLFCDGTNVYLSQTDFVNTALTGVPTAPTAVAATNTTQIATTAFVKSQGYATLASPVLTGVPTAPTPAQFDNSAAVPTTAFVQRSLGNFQGIAQYLVNGATISSADVGKVISLSNASPYAVNLPLLSSVPLGASLVFINTNAGAVTLNRSGSDLIAVGGVSLTSIVVPPNATLFLAYAAGVWECISCDAALPRSPMFSASLTGVGYQKLPSGLIIQWGSIAITSTGTLVFPIAFPNGCAYATASAYLNSGESPSATSLAGVELNSLTPTSMKINSSNAGARSCSWMAIGY